MNLDFIINHIPMYIKAIRLTLFLGVTGILFSIIIGLFCAFILYYKVPLLKITVSAYIELSRNTPLVIQLFFLYFGLPKIGIKLSSHTCAITGLSFLGGSYMCEAFRSGLEAVKKSQIESGLSIGLTEYQLVTSVILPQAFSIALPAIGANTIFLMKETSVVGILALMDLMFLTKDLIGLYYNTTEALFMLIIAYLIIIFPISQFLTYAERRVRYAVSGN